MYHSVGRELPDWRWSKTLTIPAEVFEDHLRWLARAGYRTVGLTEVGAHVREEALLPERSVVLTFDDGYVDNWTYVVPLLEKYSMAGTILVTPQFVDPHDIVRPTLADVWSGHAQESELEVRGFMSWPELRTSIDRGVLAVQCHALTHTWYPTGPQVVDFHHPGDGHYWLDWNADPTGKPYYLREPNASKVPWGTPVYEHMKSLEATRYFPPDEESKTLVAHVASHGGANFFARRGWHEELRSILARVRANARDGRYETDAERAARYTEELESSKRIIEDKLGVPVEYFVWPNRAYNSVSMALAHERFRALTVAGEDANGVKNRPGDDPRKISRFGVPLIPLGGRMLHPRGRYFVAYLDEFRGSATGRLRRQIMKRLYVAGAMVATKK